MMFAGIEVALYFTPIIDSSQLFARYEIEPSKFWTPHVILALFPTENTPLIHVTSFC